MSNDTRFCMALAPETLPAADKALLAGRKAALLKANQWAAASIIKVAFLDGDPGLQAKVKAVAKQWTSTGLANLTLSFIADPKQAQVRIAFTPGDGSWSYIGTYCTTLKYPEATMNFGWLTPASSDVEIGSVVLHEFGHALGLIHEHQNPQHPIKWYVAAVKKALSGPPNSWDDATIQHNMFDKYDPSKVTATDVDKTSIMMYPIPQAWTADGFSAGFNADLSAQDKALIKKCYP
jgi:serralysin